MTGYAISDYGLILIIWGISFLLFGTGLVYLLARYFRREEADVEAAEARAEVPPASAHPAAADRERELIGPVDGENMIEPLGDSAGEYAFLRDGGQILIRPYAADDRPAVEDFLNRLSDESRGLRFHSGGARVSPERVRGVVESALRREERPWLEHDEILRLLTAYGLPTPAEVVVRSPDEAAKAAIAVGGSVALKLLSTTIVHKSDVGGVRLNLRSPDAAADAYRAMADELNSRGLSDGMDGALVQEMASAGIECLVGVVTDPNFGPLIAFGLGGVAAEVIGDVGFRLHPLTDLDADELIAASRASRLLNGFRGAPPSDIASLRDFLLRLSRFVDDVPELAELDFNPVIVHEAGLGSLVVDARIRLERPA